MRLSQTCDEDRDLGPVISLLLMVSLVLVRIEPALAQQKIYRFTDPQFQHLIETFEKKIIDVFHNEFRDAALLVASDVREREILSRMTLAIDPTMGPTTCRFAPVAEPRAPDGIPRITMGRIFVGINLYVAQAVWIELLRGFQAGAIDRLDRYIDDVINRSRADIQRSCGNRGPDGLAGEFKAYPAVIGMSAQDLAALGADPVAVALGDQLGALLAFVLMHEAGHHVLGHSLGGRAAQVEPAAREMQADEFAARVFRRGGISVTAGLGAFLAFLRATPGEQAPSAAIACRVIALLQRDDMIGEQFSGPFAKFAVAVQHMRAAYLNAYRPRCH